MKALQKVQKRRPDTPNYRSIWAAAQTKGAWGSKTLLSTTINISNFGENMSGELYVTEVAKEVVYKFIAKGLPRRRADEFFR